MNCNIAFYKQSSAKKKTIEQTHTPIRFNSHSYYEENARQKNEHLHMLKSSKIFFKSIQAHTYLKTIFF